MGCITVLLPLQEQRETDEMEKERKRLKLEASWKFKMGRAWEFSKKNPMVISTAFVVILVIIMATLGMDED